MSNIGKASKVSQKCSNCGWVLSASLKKTQVVCPKCGATNTIKSMSLNSKDLESIFGTIK